MSLELALETWARCASCGTDAKAPPARRVGGLLRLLAMGLVAALTVAGCSSGNEEAPSRRGQRRGRHDQRHQSAGSRHAATGRQPAVVADRVPVELQLAAHRRQRGRRRRPCCGRRCRARSGSRSDGSTTVNTDYFTNVELTSENPQVVTYTINPKAVWSDGAPDHMGRHQVSDRRNQRQGQGLPDRQPQRQRPRRKGDPRRRRPPGRHHLRQALCGMAGNVRRQHHAAAQEHDREPRGVQQGTTRSAPARPPARS